MAPNFGIRGLFASWLVSSGTRRRRTVPAVRPGEQLEMRSLLTNPLTAIPRLNSLPGASVSIYLDFDGHTETQDWPSQRTDNQTGPIVTPVFDIDNDFTTFSDTELDMIREMWYRVAEDFAPFSVNVTTVDPGSFNNFEAVLVSVGGNGSWIGSPGGIAFLNAFNNGVVNTCYVFSDNVGRGGVDHMKGAAMAASHEVGHQLGLNHHSVYDASGNKTSEYDPGTAILGPIMGAPYGSYRETWFRAADTSGPNNIQDDFLEMTRAANRTFVFRADDAGDTNATATPYVVTSPNFLQRGVIGQNNDIDVYMFETDAGPISFTVEGLDLRKILNNNALTPGTNADLILELRDRNGNVIASDNPAGGQNLSATVSATVAQGSYFLAVSTTGQYGAIGQYTISGTVVPLPSIPTMIGPVGTLADPVPVFTWATAANIKSYSLEVEIYNSTTKTWSLNYRKDGLTVTTFTADRQFEQGDFRARVRALGNNDKFTEYSNYVSFTIDVPAPGIPTLLKPIGEIGEPFPVFEWAAAANANLYTLWVVNRTTGQRVIYRTDYKGLTYVHFSALANGSYRAWLQASNTVGERSAWSRPVDFVVAAPRPAAPTLLAPIGTTTSANPRFIWTDVKAARYELHVNNRTTGTARYLLKSDIPGTTTFFDPTLFTQGSYTAWIRAFNGSNEAGPWSAPLNFVVDILPPARTVMTGPLGVDGTRVVNTLNPTYTWKAAARAETYELYVNNVTTGEFQVIRKNDITGLSFTPLVSQKQGEIRAWVRGINSAKEVGDWSPVYTFVIDEATPLTPTITAPVANPAGSVEDANPTFAWSIAADAPFYQLEVYEVNPNTGKRTRVLLQNGITDKFFTVPNLQRLKETTYVARVRGYNLSNEFGNWSPDYSFRIDVPDAVTPRILGPGNTINDSTPVLTWTHNRATIRYEVLIRDLIRDEVITLQVTSFGVNPGGTEAFYTIPDDKALRASTYRFWVRGFNSMQQPGGWSEPQSFILTLSALEPQVGDQPEPELEVLAALLPQRPQVAKRQSIMDPAAEAPASEVEVVAVAVSELPANVSGGAVEAALSSSDEELIDQAIWMLINPAAPAFEVEEQT